jgi:PAS domain S-box-containing protein
LFLGAVLSTRLYLKTGIALIGYVAFAQAGLAFSLVVTFSGMNRYSLGWYLTRMLPTVGAMVILFGLLSEYVRLIRREKESEKLLRDSRAKIDAAFSSMTDAVLFSDEQGHAIDFNNAFAAFYRFDNKEACAVALPEFPRILDVRTENGEPAPPESWAVARALRGEADSNVVYTLMRRDTGESWAGSYSFGPIRDCGRIVGAVVVARDITGRMKMEEALRQSEQHLRNVLNSMVAMIGVMTPDGILIEANREALNVAGLVPQDVLNKPFDECYWWSWSADEQQRLRKAIRRAAAGRASRYDAVIRGAEGRLRTIDFMLSPIFGPDGQVSHLIPSATDITDRKITEQALAQSESFHRQTLESIPGMVFTTRPDGYCDYQSQQWVDYTGVPMSEMLGDGWTRLLHAEDRPRAFAAWRSAVDKDAPYDLEYRVRRHDGVYEWFRVIGRQIHDDKGLVIRWFGVAMNIEALKKTEERLRGALAVADERRRIFDTMMEHIPMGIIVADAPDVTIRAVSRFGLEMAGRPEERPEGIPVDRHAGLWKILQADGATPAQSKALPLSRAVRKGESIQQEEWTILRPDGRKVPILCTAAPIRDSQGAITGGVVGYQDITDRKRVEEALRESEQRFRELADSMPQLVWTADPDGHVDYYNVRHRELRGIERLADGTYQWDPVLHAEDEAPTVEAWRRACRTGEIYQIEHRVLLIDGSYRWHLSRGIPVRDEAGWIVKWFGTATDIENVKKAEAQLRQLNETLEQKVAERTRVAEERTRELQALAVELIEAEERERQRVSRLLHDDLQQMLAAAKMQLHTVPESMSGEPGLVHVGKILDDSIAVSRRLSHELSPPVLFSSGLVGGLHWLAAEMEEKFGLRIDLKATPDEISLSDPLKIFLFRAAKELLFNVVKHAASKNAALDLSRSNGHLVLAVSDRGNGFDPGILCTGHAKGLGLISLRERAHAFGGGLKIESEPGRGSRFMLEIPIGPGKKENH